MPMRSPEQVAMALIDAVTRADLDLVDALYADDAVSWQNTTGKTTDKARALQTVRWLCSHTRDLAYSKIRRQCWADGFVQEHRMTGRTLSGDELLVDACLVVTVRDGQMVDVREYMDSRAQDVFSS